MEFFTHPYNGADLKFAHLTVYDLFGDPTNPELNGFVPIYRKRCKSQLLENMKTVGLPMEQQLAELIGFDNQPVGMNTFLKYVGGDAKALIEVVSFSYKAANGKDILPLPEKFLNEVMWMILAPMDIFPTPPEDANDPEPKGDDSATFGDGGAEPDPLKIPPTFSATPGVDSALTTETTIANQD